jgi:hypothetical protein
VAVTRRMPRVQAVVLPVLRDSLGPDVKVGSWVEGVDLREMPLINVRRLGGVALDIDQMDRATIELTAYGNEGLVQTENLLLDARQVIWDMVDRQVVTPKGYLHSFRETMGPTQFDSPYDGTWRIQCLIQLGLRPPRTS